MRKHRESSKPGGALWQGPGGRTALPTGSIAEFAASLRGVLPGVASSQAAEQSGIDGQDRHIASGVQGGLDGLGKSGSRTEAPQILAGRDVQTGDHLHVLGEQLARFENSVTAIVDKALKRFDRDLDSIVSKHLDRLESHLSRQSPD